MITLANSNTKTDLLADLSPEQTALEIKNLDLFYGDKQALYDVSMKIPKGKVTAFIGPSGCGKSTLLNILGMLDSPSSGSYKFQDEEIAHSSEKQLANLRKENVGFIFQNYNLISTLTAEENVMFPMKLACMTLKEQRERAVSLLKQIGLGDRREHLPFQLSAGEQQRVAIARALANDPPIILADEPTANLDKSTSLFIRDMFKAMKKDNKTIIIATHDDFLIELASRIINFEDNHLR